MGGTAGEVGIHHPDREDHEADATDGVAPVRREPIAKAGDPNRLNVFITGLFGTGALTSVVIGLIQAIGSARTQRRISLRVRPRAEALAAAVVHGFEPRAVGRTGLRPRGYYAWLAVVGSAWPCSFCGEATTTSKNRAKPDRSGNWCWD